jgi:hypothetical protein
MKQIDTCLLPEHPAPSAQRREQASEQAKGAEAEALRALLQIKQ